MGAREKVKIILAQSLGIEPSDIDEGSLLREDLELDATDISEIIDAVVKQLGIELPGDEAEDLSTVGELLDWIEQYSSDAGI